MKYWILVLLSMGTFLKAMNGDCHSTLERSDSLENLQKIRRRIFMTKAQREEINSRPKFVPQLVSEELLKKAGIKSKTKKKSLEETEKKD